MRSARHRTPSQLSALLAQRAPYSTDSALMSSSCPQTAVILATPSPTDPIPLAKPEGFTAAESLLHA